MLKLKEKTDSSSFTNVSNVNHHVNNRVTVFDRKNFIIQGNVIKLIGTAAYGVTKAGKSIFSVVTGTITKASNPISKVKNGIVTLGNAFKKSKVANLLKFREKKLPIGGLAEEDSVPLTQEQSMLNQTSSLNPKYISGFAKRIEKKK